MAYFTRDEIMDIKKGVTNSDFYAVAAYYGIPIKKGSILCPFHDDRHYGSAKIGAGRNSAYCFVCNRAISVFDLIMNEEGVTFTEAVRIYWCTIMGNPEPEREAPLKKWRPGRKDLKFLGLFGRRDRIQIMPANMVYRLERNNLPKGWDYDRDSYDVKTDTFVCGPIVRQESLYSLEEEVYWEIIRGKSKENVETREKRLKDAYNPSTWLGHMCCIEPELGKEVIAKLQQELAYAKRLDEKIKRASA